MDRPELALLKKIRLQPGKKINTLFMGEYHSAFRGQGLSFDSVRSTLRRRRAEHRLERSRRGCGISSSSSTSRSASSPWCS